MPQAKACVIRLDPPKLVGNRIRLDGHLEIPNKPAWDVTFEFTCPHPAQTEIRARPFVLAFLPIAMRLGLPLRCEHPIDSVTHAQLYTWQSCFAGWLPLRLKVVDLEIPIADESKLRTGGGAITAFSGGADSCFTVVRHAGKSSPELHHTSLQAGLMIHGFDIQGSAESAFEEALSSSRAVLNAYNLETYSLRTNIRERRGQPKLCWERESHGIWLAASLSCLEPWFDVMVIPSSYAYDRAVHPWGSNSETDTLLGSKNTPVVHEGVEFSKYAKLLKLAGIKSVTDNMRTCSDDNQSGKNCGHCLKCSSTQVVLELCGCTRPKAFPERYTLADITDKQAYSRNFERPVRAYIKDILGLAKEKGRADLVAAYQVTLSSFERAAKREAISGSIRRTILRFLGTGK